MDPEQVIPLPSAPQRPLVLTFVGTGGAVDDVVVGVGVAVDVGVGGGVVVLIVDEVRVDDELGIGAGTEEDGGSATPLHVPK